MLVALAITAPVIGAPLGPIDDHQILDIARAPITLTVFVERAHEVGRFRPLYWVGQLLETAIWGTSATGWLLDRLALAFATVLLGWAIARRYVREALALAAAALVVVGPQAEAWYRFGPQEAYATPLLLGSTLALLGGRLRTGLVLAILVAYTKEAFVAAALLLIGLAWIRGARWAAIGASVPVAVAGVIIAWLALTSPTLSTLGSLAQGRYLLPLVFVPIAGIVFVARRWPRVGFGLMAVWLVVGYSVALPGGLRWARINRTWADDIANARIAIAGSPDVPVVVHASTASYELVFSLHSWIPDAALELEVAPGRGYLWTRLRSIEDAGGFGYAQLAAGPHVDLYLKGLRLRTTP